MKPFNLIKFLAIALLLSGAWDYKEASLFFWSSKEGSWFYIVGTLLHLTAALGILLWRRPGAVLFIGVNPAKP